MHDLNPTISSSVIHPSTPIYPSFSPDRLDAIDDQLLPDLLRQLYPLTPEQRQQWYQAQFASPAARAARPNQASPSSPTPCPQLPDTLDQRLHDALAQFRPQPTSAQPTQSEPLQSDPLQAATPQASTKPDPISLFFGALIEVLNRRQPQPALQPI